MNTIKWSQNMSRINVQSISIFHLVDSLVKDIINKEFELNNFELCELTNQLNQLQQPFFSLFDNDYCYSNTIEAFIGACHACIGAISLKEFIWNKSSTEEFIDYLKLDREYITCSINAQLAQETANCSELERYARKVLDKYAKSLVVLVSVSYQPEQRQQVSLEDFQEHFANFRDLISNKKTCFEDLVGYAWAIEQGLDKGYHCHLWLVYNGSKRQSDFYIGKEVGEKWLKITNGMGEYHNSNNPDTKDYYRRLGILGIGRIHREFNNEIENAVIVAKYLAKPSKDDQYVVVKPIGMRTFGKGILR